MGQASMGVSNAMAWFMRRASAAAMVLGGTLGKQSVDLTLIMTDGWRKDMADPALDAHDQPVGFWAMAVWDETLYLGTFNDGLFSGLLAPLPVPLDGRAQLLASADGELEARRGRWLWCPVYVWH